MKLAIEIITTEDPTGDAEKLRQIANMLDGGLESWPPERFVNDAQEDPPEPERWAEASPVAPSALAPPEAPQAPLTKDEISRLQFQVKSLAGTLSTQDRHIFEAFKHDIKARYATTDLNKIPAEELPKILKEIEDLLDGDA